MNGDEALRLPTGESVRLLLDTTVLIDAIRGLEATLDRLRALEGRPLISAISVHEVLLGARERERRSTEQLLAWPLVVDVGLEAATISARWRQIYSRRGVTLALADTLVAATALTQNASLATANVRHFPMPELAVEEWPSA